MKKIITLVFSLCVVVVLSGCQGSKEIQGQWYAVDYDETQMMITIDEETISFDVEGEEETKFSYKQVGLGFKNNQSYKKIEFDNKAYTFVFPDKEDKENGLIIQSDKGESLKGLLYWKVSKNDYPTYKSSKKGVN